MKDPVRISSFSDGELVIPLAVKNFRKIKKSTGTILAGDIGGTKSNLSLFHLEEGVLLPIKENSYLTQKFNSFEEVFNTFYSADLPVIDAICLGVAGPVNNGKVSGTNFTWVLDEKEIKKTLKVNSVTVINDLETNAFGLAALRRKDFEVLREGADIPGNAAVISPGTGLGEAGLYWDGTHFHPFPSEGGHCEFSPRSDFEIRLWKFLHNKFGHVSWERILSGPGINNLYQFLIEDGKVTEPDWFKQRLLKEDPAALISSCAAEDSFSVCKETMRLFCTYLAIESTQLALKFKATGGIFIGGGILPKNLNCLDKEVFNSHFLKSDRMRPLLELVPVRVILNPKTSLFGAAFCGAMKLRS